MVTRTNKLVYYIHNLLRQLAPGSMYENALPSKLNTIDRFDKATLLDRVNYYNKLKAGTPLGDHAQALKSLRVFEGPKTYHFDAFEFTRYFNRNFKANFLFGDCIHTEDVPTIQKSRPVDGDNSNGVLLKLNKTRHFIFVKDKKTFASKKNQLIGRATVRQEHRVRFMEQYFNHPLCDLGQVNREGGRAGWLKPRISRSAHLEYKFILSLEGNDVASNLKWIMSSNSIAVMPKPKYETWFMEGRLIGDHHYIQIRDDFSDLEEKLNYYISNEQAALRIIENANKHVKQFFDKKQEDLISLLVLQKYFYCTGQTARYELLQDNAQYLHSIGERKAI